MKAHVQLVAILHIALGVMSLLAAIAVFAFLGLASGIVMSQGEPQAGGIVAIVAVAVGGFLAVLSLPGIIGGWALYTERAWGRPVILVLSVLHILNFPLGTALSVYSFWALLKDPQPSSSGAAGVQAVG